MAGRERHTCDHQFPAWTADSSLVPSVTPDFLRVGTFYLGAVIYYSYFVLFEVAVAYWWHPELQGVATRSGSTSLFEASTWHSSKSVASPTDAGN